MSLKRQNDMISAFSMSSMTDIIFLLLIFFMVSSTYIFPTALEVNLPESSEQTAIKPGTSVFIDAEMKLYASSGDEEPVEMTFEQLLPYLRQHNTEEYIAIYADEEVTYGKLVEVLSLGAVNNLKMVLATKPAPALLQQAAANNEATADNEAQPTPQL